jgi:hypothetical protein
MALSEYAARRLSNPDGQAAMANRKPKPNPWPGNPNAYPCPWGCNGTGSMPWFSHIADGACFSCRGEGWILGRAHQQIRERPANEPRRRWRREGNRIVPA